MSVLSAQPTVLDPLERNRAESTLGPRSVLPVYLLGALAAAVAGVAVGLGYALGLAAAVVALGAVVITARTRLGFLHLLVLAPFAESLAIGPVTIGRLLAAVAGTMLLFLLVTGRLRCRASRRSPGSRRPRSCCSSWPAGCGRRTRRPGSSRSVRWAWPSSSSPRSPCWSRPRSRSAACCGSTCWARCSPPPSASRRRSPPPGRWGCRATPTSTPSTRSRRCRPPSRSPRRAAAP